MVTLQSPTDTGEAATHFDAISGVRTLASQIINRGDRWIFSAGFNVRADQKDMARVDCELQDLEYLLAAGARVAILSHQGSYKNGDAESLQFLASYLSRRLNKEIGYSPQGIGADAVDAALALTEGNAILFGNTRFYQGEEENDPLLAREFARLGDKCALGGFSKGHQNHASNVGILQYIPAYATESLMEETRFLAPWAGADSGKYSVCVLAA